MECNESKLSQSARTRARIALELAKLPQLTWEMQGAAKVFTSPEVSAGRGYNRFLYVSLELRSVLVSVSMSSPLLSADARPLEDLGRQLFANRWIESSFPKPWSLVSRAPAFANPTWLTFRLGLSRMEPIHVEQLIRTVNELTSENVRRLELVRPSTSAFRNGVKQ